MNKQVKRAALAAATSMVLAASGAGVAAAAIVTPEAFRSWGGHASCPSNQRVLAEGGWSAGQSRPFTLAVPGATRTITSASAGDSYVVSPNASSGSWEVSGLNATWGSGGCR